ncbi:MAG TPA: tetratricopeptide repeat protein, partial [Chroococcales cyanobacterium]
MIGSRSHSAASQKTRFFQFKTDRSKNGGKLSTAITAAFCLTAMLAAAAGAGEEDSVAMRKAEALFSQGKIKEATAAYQDVIRSEPDNAKAHERLGACMAATVTGSATDKDAYETAILEEKTAIRLDPKYFLPHSMLGKIYTDQGKLDEAIAEFREALKLKPNSMMGHLDLGLTLTCSGKTDEAIAIYKKAADLDPKDCRPHTNLGVLYDMKNDFDNAVKEEETAISLSKASKQKEYELKSYANLGNFYGNKGEVDPAINAFKNALKINAKDPNANSGLGWMLQKKGDFKGAIACQRK